jgi:hypothetical protein
MKDLGCTIITGGYESDRNQHFYLLFDCVLHVKMDSKAISVVMKTDCETLIYSFLIDDYLHLVLNSCRSRFNTSIKSQKFKVLLSILEIEHPPKLWISYGLLPTWS